MQNLHVIGVFVDAIVDHNRTVQELSNPRSSRYRRADVRKGPQQIDVIQDRITEAFGIAGKANPRIGQDVLKLR
jgi:hypothetical protein